jgi:hypothetical protein
LEWDEAPVEHKIKKRKRNRMDLKEDKEKMVRNSIMLFLGLIKTTG